MSESHGSGVISGIISTLSFGFILTSVTAALLQIDPTYDFLANLYNGFILVPSNFQNYLILLFSWALGGAIAGVRTKNSHKGFLSGFFGAFIGGLAALLFYMSSFGDDFAAFNFDPIITAISDTLPGFAIGLFGLMLAASFAGLVVGKSTTEPVKAKPKAKSKVKTWSDKSKWNCSNCGEPIPPGKMNCPKCGKGVIQ